MHDPLAVAELRQRYAQQLTVALQTPPGRGPIAMLQLHGPVEQLAAVMDQVFRPKNGQPWASQTFPGVVLGRWGEEDLVVCSAEERTLSIMPHGGTAAVARVEADLVRHGALRVDVNTQMYAQGYRWSEVEWAAAYYQARTPWALKALEKLAGPLPSWCDALRSATTPLDQKLKLIRNALKYADWSRQLLEGSRVVFCGVTNAGKSSLMNALLGFDRSIVHNMPGVTRDVLTSHTAFQGIPVILTDTAGLRQSTDELEVAGMTRAVNAVASADLVLHVIDPGQPDAPVPDLGDRPCVPVITKCDLYPHASRMLAPGQLAVSSVSQAGLAALKQAIADKLLENQPPADAVFPVTIAHRDALIRLETALRTHDDATSEALCQAL